MRKKWVLRTVVVGVVGAVVGLLMTPAILTHQRRAADCKAIERAIRTEGHIVAEQLPTFLSTRYNGLLLKELSPKRARLAFLEYFASSFAVTPKIWQPLQLKDPVSKLYQKRVIQVSQETVRSIQETIQQVQALPDNASKDEVNAVGRESGKSFAGFRPFSPVQLPEISTYCSIKDTDLQDKKR